MSSQEEEASDSASDHLPAVSRARFWSAAILLFAATLAVYSGVTDHGLIILDDPGYVSDARVQRGLTWDGVRWAFTESHSANWHPLTWLSHMLDVELFGDDVGKHHLESAVLHGLNGVLLLLVLLSMTRRFWPSVIVAALFALHPQRVESVAWASERKDVLSALFFFLALYAYGRYARRPSVGRYVPVVLAMLLGLMAKSMLVTLPFVLLLLDRWPLGRWKSDGTTLRRLVLEKLPLFALSIAGCGITVWAQTEGDALRTVEALPFSARFANAAVSYSGYVTKAVWPDPLAILYPHPALANRDAYSALSAASVISGVLILLAIALAIRAVRRKPWLAVGLFWYLGMLVPVIGIVQVGAQSMADRYTYLPFIGLLVAVVWSAAALPSSKLRVALGALALFCAGIHGAVARNYVAKWRDTETLFEHTIAVTENNYSAHSKLGLVYMQAGEFERAIPHFEERQRINPGMGVTLNLGIAYFETGDVERAGQHIDAVLQARPAQFEANFYVGMLHSRASRHRRAVDHLRIAVAERPGRADVRSALATAMIEVGDRAGALPHLTRALAAADTPPEALERMAWLRATSAAPDLRDPKEALRLVRRLVPANGRADWRTLRTLAAAQAANGDFESAKRTAISAELAAPAEEAPKIARDAQRYRAGKALAD